MRDELRRLERRVTALLRSPRTRMVGLVLGVVALGVLGTRLVRDLDTTLQTARAIGFDGVLLALACMLVWHTAPVSIAARFGSPDPAGVWAHAQLLKYVPVPASAVAGFVGSSVRAGARTAAAVRVLVWQTLALVLGAATVGAWAVWRWVAGTAHPLVGVAAGVAAVLLVVAWVAAARDRDWRVAGVTSVAGWVLVAAGTGFGLGGTEPLLVGAAIAAAWVAGQVVVPVPAGLGVRELVLVALLQDAVGTERALVIALLARVVHTLSDVLMAAGVLGRRRFDRSASRPS